MICRFELVSSPSTSVSSVSSVSSVFVCIVSIVLAKPKVKVLRCETKTNQFQSFAFAFLAFLAHARESPRVHDAVEGLGQNLRDSPRKFGNFLLFLLRSFSSLSTSLDQGVSVAGWSSPSSSLLPSSLVSGYPSNRSFSLFPFISMATTNAGAPPAKAPFGKPKSYPFWLGGKLSFTHLLLLQEFSSFFVSFPFLSNRCRG